MDQTAENDDGRDWNEEEKKVKERRRLKMRILHHLSHPLVQPFHISVVTSMLSSFR